MPMAEGTHLMGLWDATPFMPLKPLLVFIFFGPAEVFICGALQAVLNISLSLFEDHAA